MIATEYAYEEYSHGFSYTHPLMQARINVLYKQILEEVAKVSILHKIWKRSEALKCVSIVAGRDMLNYKRRYGNAL